MSPPVAARSGATESRGIYADVEEMAQSGMPVTPSQRSVR